MNTEHRETPSTMSPRQAHYITLEMCWRFNIGWQECPNKLYLSSWLNRAQGDWKLVCDAIEAAGERQVDDPQQWIWGKLKRAFPPPQPRWISSQPFAA